MFIRLGAVMVIRSLDHLVVRVVSVHVALTDVTPLRHVRSRLAIQISNEHGIQRFRKAVKVNTKWGFRPTGSRIHTCLDLAFC